MDQFPHPHEDGVVVDLRAPRERLRVNEHRLGGHPTVGDTRIPYDDVAALVATGEVRPEEVAEYYPGVTAEHARQAVDLAAQVDAGQGWVPLENAGRTA
ncbi:DUF433 domain-containing protein [Corynebacterium frankenforstense]|uniref:DUF433 domain-containing protein n=1 Tax=Corynebacterium frankenforstense TaxID=1230998 RepID=UPI001FE8E4A7|nr:DUF433 domain-containing protein [Corynebacterium frankenforstense]